MYRCTNCSAEIESGILARNHLTSDEYYALEEVCPYCRNYIVKIEEGDENDN